MLFSVSFSGAFWEGFRVPPGSLLGTILYQKIDRKIDYKIVGILEGFRVPNGFQNGPKIDAKVDLAES